MHSDAAAAIPSAALLAAQGLGQVSQAYHFGSLCSNVSSLSALPHSSLPHSSLPHSSLPHSSVPHSILPPSTSSPTDRLSPSAKRLRLETASAAVVDPTNGTSSFLLVSTDSRLSKLQLSRVCGPLLSKHSTRCASPLRPNAPLPARLLRQLIPCQRARAKEGEGRKEGRRGKWVSVGLAFGGPFAGRRRSEQLSMTGVCVVECRSTVVVGWSEGVLSGVAG